ncbi:MAG: hypothetical protein AAF943_15210 [Pseudomonadota bacterium]
MGDSPANFGHLVFQFVLAFAKTFVLNLLLFPMLISLWPFVGAAVAGAENPSSAWGLFDIFEIFLVIVYENSLYLACYAIIPCFVFSAGSFTLVYLSLWLFQSVTGALIVAFPISMALGAIIGLFWAFNTLDDISIAQAVRQWGLFLSVAASAAFCGFLVARHTWT